MKRPPCFATRASRPVEIAQRMNVSLQRVPSVDDLDPHGTWGGSKIVSDHNRNVTAAICGDPAPGRSALDQLREVQK